MTKRPLSPGFWENASDACKCQRCVQFTLDYTSLAGRLQKVEATLMSMSFEELVEHAMALPSESRALLADRLVESLDAAEMNRFDRLWAAEAQRRLDDVRSGRVVPIPGEQVLAEMRKRFGG